MNNQFKNIPDASAESTLCNQMIRWIRHEINRDNKAYGYWLKRRDDAYRSLHFLNGGYYPPNQS